MANKTIGYIGTMGQGCPSPEGDCSPVTCTRILTCEDFRACFGITGSAGSACLPPTLDPPFGILGECGAAMSRGIEVSGCSAGSDPVYCPDGCGAFSNAFLFDTVGTNLYPCTCGIFGRQGFSPPGVCQDAVFCQGGVQFSIEANDCGAKITVDIGFNCSDLFLDSGDSASYALFGDAATDAITGMCNGTAPTATLPKISETSCGGTFGNPTAGHCCGPFSDTIQITLI